MYRKTVLLIEDDKDSREIYGTVLRHGGFRVLEATDGGDAGRLAREFRPDLIVMDLALPIMDGWQATEMLKQDPETTHIPVVAVTVHVHEFYRGRAQVVGCDGFLDKPCTPTQLLAEVERLLPRG